jgi:diguanylate cyclase
VRSADKKLDLPLLDPPRSLLAVEKEFILTATPAPPDEARTPYSPTQSLAGFVADLLDLLKVMAAKVGRRPSDEYRTKLDEYAAGVAEETDAYRLEILRGNCLKTSQEYFKEWDRHLKEREDELRDVIDLLMTGLQTISKDNTTFHTELTATNERIQGYCDLDDIREIKKRLANEVARLKETIKVKQQSEAAQISVLSDRVTTLQSKLQEAEQKAQTDGLTGLYNRASFDRKMTELIETAQGFVLVLLDIDNFKQINDTHGHQIGDRVIASAAQMLRESTRASDFVARYGGEEFAIIQPGSKIEHALPRFAARLKEIAETTYEYRHLFRKQELSFTLSAGLTECVAGDTIESVVARADAALYQAKREGKNRVIAKRRE